MAKLEFIIPDTIKHEEVKTYMRAVVKNLKAEKCFNATDFPQLRRMAAAYDQYLNAEEFVAENGPTMTNIKGEEVKHPMFNIMRENWNQFLELSKEYGFTVKSKSKIKGLQNGEEPESPLDKFQKNRKK